MSVSTLVAAPLLLMIQVPGAGGSTLATVAGVADIVVSLALLALVVVATVTARSLFKTSEKVRGLIERIEGDVTTVTRTGAVIAQHAQEIAAIARRDVQQLHETVTLANEGARRGVATIEARVRSLGVAMDSVQTEVEGVLTSTASVMRGLREGAGAIPRGLIARFFRPRRRKAAGRRRPEWESLATGSDDGATPGSAPTRSPATRGPRIRPTDRPRSNRGP